MERWRSYIVGGGSAYLVGGSKCGAREDEASACGECNGPFFSVCEFMCGGPNFGMVCIGSVRGGCGGATPNLVYDGEGGAVYAAPVFDRSLRDDGGE